jgi:hypothetical protein
LGQVLEVDPTDLAAPDDTDPHCRMLAADIALAGVLGLAL